MSVASETTYDAALKMISEMSFTDKLRMNADLSVLMKKDGKSGSVGKAAKKEKKEKNPDAPKRKAAVGTLAWQAFIKHQKKDKPDRFEDCKTEPQRLVIASAIRAEDEEAYKAFVKKFKEEHSSSKESSETEAVVLTPQQKLEAMKAAAKLKAKPVAAEKPKKEVKKAAPKPKKEVKEVKEEVKDDSPKKTINGKVYNFDPESNGLWEIGGNGVAAWTWVGKFQPDNEEEPIEYCDAE